MKNNIITIAVDFDGTLCEDAFPEIGEPKHFIINYVKRLAKNGAKIILHTCRENVPERAFLTEAVWFCRDNEIPLDGVNANPFSPYSKLYNAPPSRKLYADVYIDDRAVNVATLERIYKDHDSISEYVDNLSTQFFENLI